MGNGVPPDFARDRETTRAIRQCCAPIALAILGLLAAALVQVAEAGASTADFGLESATATVSSSQAGAHADFEGRFRLMLDPTEESGGQHIPWANMRNLAIELPPGLVGSLGRFPTCDAQVFVEQVTFLSPHPSCPASSQVGLISPGVAGFLSFPPGAYRSPLYNLERPAGNHNVLARLGAISVISPLFIDIRLDAKRNDAITAELVDAPAIAGLTGSNMTLWAYPAAPSHDAERFDWREAIICDGPCSGGSPSEAPQSAVLSNPTSCEPARTGMEVTSYAEPAGGDSAFSPLGMTGCDRVPFEPTFSMKTSTDSAGRAGGMGVSLTVPQDGLLSPNALRTGDLREAKVELPVGITMNPGAASGLATCSEEQIGFDPNERQIVGLGADGAPATLDFNGQTTAPLPQLADAEQVQRALEALPDIGAGDLTVSGRRGGPWQIDFGGALGGRDVPPLTGVQSELQRLSIQAEGGSYTLGFDGQSTVPIHYDAGPGAVQSALEGLTAIKPGDITVVGEAAAGRAVFRIAFGGGFAGVDVPKLTVGAAALAGIHSSATISGLIDGGSPVVVETVEQGGSLRFDADQPGCPEASKIGSGTLTTPLLPGQLTAAVYLAAPGENPFGSRYAAYLVAAGDGVVLKVPGRFELDPVTGQVGITFTNFPQLPLETVSLDFKEGNRGLLTMPANCGTYASSYELVSWSGAAVKGSSEIPIRDGCGSDPSSPRFQAGSTTAVAGGFTSVLVQLLQGPGAAPISRLSVDLPPGLVANLKGVGTCPDTALAGEGAGPRCPADSKIGTVTLGAGSGTPTYLSPGSVYLAGPYRGAPWSLALSVPAVVGPFDLGSLLVRAALSVDPATAQVRAISDPIPAFVDGVPLYLRDLRILIDRPGFMINPTSCEESAVTGAIERPSGATSPVSDRFQVAECSALSFRPQLKVGFNGAVGRSGHPGIRTVLKPHPGGANLASLHLELPRAELLDVGHIHAVCGQARLARGQCPRGSKLGHASVRSPILAKPLHGPIFLRASTDRLPDLVADLHGPPHFVLDGRIGYAHEALSVSFPNLPDIPISKAVIALAGGSRGLLVNSRSLCAEGWGSAARVLGHNGQARGFRPHVIAECASGLGARPSLQARGRRRRAAMPCGEGGPVLGSSRPLGKRTCR